MRNNLKKIFLLFLLAFLPFLIFAQKRPKPGEAKKVIDYYYNGKENGAILMEYKLCEKVIKRQCLDTFEDGIVNQKQPALIWMKFLVPEGSKATVLLQYKRNNKYRRTQIVTVTGSIRYRIWKPILVNKIGDWSIEIVQESDDGDEDISLGKINYTVVDDSQ